MALQLEGLATVANGVYQTLSSTSTPRQCFIQARSNTFVRRVGTTDLMVVLGETTGSAVDLGVQAPNSLEFAGVGATSIVSMWSLDVGERR
jgi:hypothetical protein